MISQPQGSGSRITGFSIRPIRISAKTIWRHIELTDENGQVGTGEYSYDRAPANIDDMAADAARRLIGSDASAASLQPLSSLLRAGFAEATIYSALEQALVDLEARLAGKPVFEYFGGSASAVPVGLYANINRRTTDRSPEGFARSSGQAIDAGHTAIKLAPFDGLTPDLCGTEQGDSAVADGLARIASVAGRAAGKARVMVDCHWRFDSPTALACLERIADLGVTWFECPLPENDETVESLVAVRRAANDRGVRLAGLEKGVCWQGFEVFVKSGAYDVIMPDIKHAGGYRAIVDIAEQALKAGTAVSLHNPTGPIAHQASVHLTAALQTGELLELQFDESPMFMSVTEPQPVMVAGACTPSDSGGLGVRLAPDAF